MNIINYNKVKDNLNLTTELKSSINILNKLLSYSYYKNTKILSLQNHIIDKYLSQIINMNKYYFYNKDILYISNSLIFFIQFDENNSINYNPIFNNI